LLGQKLEPYKNARTLVLGIPRGGVVVASEIAKVLHADLDVIVSHKIGAPGNPEFAIGSVSEQGEIFLDERTRHLAQPGYIEKERKEQLRLIQKRLGEYRAILPRTPLKDRTVIITDDGVAMGFTLQAAIQSARIEHPAKIILALPVGPPETVERLSQNVEEAFVISTPWNFHAVSQFYEEFPQTTDEEVLEILRHESARRAEELKRKHASKAG
jgi:predicted phosphoribosyltransferase